MKRRMFHRITKKEVLLAALALVLVALSVPRLPAEDGRTGIGARIAATFDRVIGR